MGIFLISSKFNLIKQNKMNFNDIGIVLYFSNNNSVIENVLIGNRQCFFELDCAGNLFENNSCEDFEEKIPGYNLFFLLIILSLVAIILIKELKKS